MSAIRTTIRYVIEEYGRLSDDIADIGDDQDLYVAGMTSHANVNVMLALEEEFDVEFPEEMLVRTTFETVSAIERSVTQLLETQMAV